MKKQVGFMKRMTGAILGAAAAGFQVAGEGGGRVTIPGWLQRNVRGQIIDTRAKRNGSSVSGAAAAKRAAKKKANVRKRSKMSRK